MGKATDRGEKRAAPRGLGYGLATEATWLASAVSDSGPQRDYLTFVVGEETYAIDILRIRRLHRG